MKRYISEMEVGDIVFDSNNRLIALLQIDNVSEMEVSEYVEMLQLLDEKREVIYGLLHMINN